MEPLGKGQTNGRPYIQRPSNPRHLAWLKDVPASPTSRQETPTLVAKISKGRQSNRQMWLDKDCFCAIDPVPIVVVSGSSRIMSYHALHLWRTVNHALRGFS